MRLTPTMQNTRRLPIRTVSEIAEVLNISTQLLMRALKDADAPKPVMLAAQTETNRSNKIWYEPKEVVRWYKNRPVNQNAEKRRDYHRNYYRECRSVQAKKEQA